MLRIVYLLYFYEFTFSVTDNWYKLEKISWQACSKLIINELGVVKLTQIIYKLLTRNTRRSIVPLIDHCKLLKIFLDGKKVFFKTPILLNIEAN